MIRKLMQEKLEHGLATQSRIVEDQLTFRSSMQSQFEQIKRKV